MNIIPMVYSLRRKCVMQYYCQFMTQPILYIR